MGSGPDQDRNSLTEGRTFAGRYEVREHLGSGGMGEVYRVRDRVLDEEVALKTLTSSLITREGVELFKEEVKLARRVTHKNVARVFDIGHAQTDNDGSGSGSGSGTLYLTMELIRGETLRKRVRRPPALGLVEALSIGRGIAAGLGAAHEAGIAHRDVKPGNVMLTTTAAGADRLRARADDVRIIDFGGAQLVTGDSTAPNVGTVKYMAPEQLLGDAVGAAADVYALGLVLFEMIAGAPPFGDGNDELRARARITDAAPDLQRFVHVPAELAQLVARCLSLDTRARPSAHEVEAGLAALATKAIALDTFEVTHLQPLERTESYSTEERRAGSALEGPRATRSIAVLPFASTRDDDDGRALARGVTSALREILATTAGLDVQPAVWSEERRDVQGRRAHALRDAGRALDVDVVVEGTLAFAERERVHVSARVVDTESARTLASAEARGKIGEVMLLQHGIAERIAEALRVQLSAHAWRGVVPDEAMQLWLRARARARQGVTADLVVDHEELERCLSLAPELRPAWAARALVAVRLALLPVDTHRDWDEPARQAVADALREAADVADTRLAAALLAEHDGRYDLAVREAHEALQLAPSFAEAHELLGRLEMEAGHYERAGARLRWAARLDRRCISSLALLERGAHLRGRPDLAERVAHCLDGVRGTLEHLLLKMRLRIWNVAAPPLASEQEALRHQVEAVPFEPGRSLFPVMYAIAFASSDDAKAKAIGELRVLVERLKRRAPRTRYLLVLHQLCAEVLAMRGDPNDALEHIVEAAHGGLFDLDWLDRCPALRDLRDDPRFVSARTSVALRVRGADAPGTNDSGEQTVRMRR